MKAIHRSLSGSAQRDKKCEPNTTVRTFRPARMVAELCWNRAIQIKTAQRQATRPWPPPTPPLPKRKKVEREETEQWNQYQTFPRPQNSFAESQNPKPTSAKRRRRRGKDPSTGKYKRSNKRSAQALQKRELRKRIRELRAEAVPKQHTKDLSNKEEQGSKGEVTGSGSKARSSNQTFSDTESVDWNTSGSETVESDSSSISVVPPASCRGEPRAWRFGPGALPAT